MFFAPAAMFAMFFYLSQYIQTVMGYSPIEAGVAFLPFCFGLVAAAGISSSLVNRIDPKYLAGVGTLMAAVALWGFSRLPVRHVVADQQRPGHLCGRPAAVHPADVLRHGDDLRAAHVDRRAPPAQRGHRHRFGCAEHDAAGRRGSRALAARHGRDPDDRRPGAPARHRGREGCCRRRACSSPRRSRRSPRWSPATRSSPTEPLPRSCSAAGLMVIASLVTWIFLNVKHEELATDGPAVEGVAVG